MLITNFHEHCAQNQIQFTKVANTNKNNYNVPFYEKKIII